MGLSSLKRREEERKAEEKREGEEDEEGEKKKEKLGSEPDDGTTVQYSEQRAFARRCGDGQLVPVDGSPEAALVGWRGGQSAIGRYRYGGGSCDWWRLHG